MSLSITHARRPLGLLPSLAMASVIIFTLAASTPAWSQQTVSAVDPLPIRDVVLFTSGVGYFQREGTVDGATVIPLVFRTQSVDDILKSLILMDPKGAIE